MVQTIGVCHNGFVMMTKKPWIVYKTESHFTVEESCCVCRSGVNFYDCRERLSTPTIQGFFDIITKIHYNTFNSTVIILPVSLNVDFLGSQNVHCT
jgi:hypothetical protein